MAKVKPDRARISKIITKFAGLGSDDTYLDDGADSMMNFRITDMGTLEKREGLRRITYFSGALRGMWEGSVNNVPYTFCVIGNTVYQADGDELYLTNLYTLGTSEGPAEFYEMDGYVYLLDGKSISVFDPEYFMFMEVVPYAPLIGENWHPTSMGASGELPNLLTPNMRVHYRNTDGATVFYLPYYAESIDCVLVDTVKTADFTFRANTNYVTVPSAAEASEIAIAFSAPFDEERRLNMLAAQRALVIQTGGIHRMLLYRTDDAYKLYLSSGVTNEMKSYCNLFYPNTAPLYFTAQNVLFIGDSQNPVTALCPYYGTALIFTKTCTRLLRLDDSGADADVIHPQIGCTPIDGAICCEDAVITVSRDGVFRLTSRASAPEDVTVERVSDRVHSRLRGYIGEDSIVFWNPQHRELWICTPQDESGLLWVWNAPQNAWYHFDGLPATKFRVSPTLGICCINSNVLYVFDELHFDDDGNSYSTYYMSKYIDLGNPDSIRHALHWAITARTTGSTNLIIYTTRGATQNPITQKTYNGMPEYYEGRIHANRHRFLRFYFSTQGSTAAALYRVAFFTKP
ncbi:MAG: hypothetical protein IJX80_09250 [Clostridia bacterium]|nr:hypothetical protein [Clostridia bacterium]